MTKETKIIGRAISKGVGEGEVLLCTSPISFYGGVDAKTGKILDSESQIKGENISRKVLVFPHGKGSTVGSYVLYRLKKKGIAPAAIVNSECEPIVAVGAIISEIPLVDKINISKLKNGQKVRVDGNSGEVALL